MAEPWSVLASIPSPSQGVWEIGPFPLRAYALCIIAGIVLAAVITEKRFVARGGAPGDAMDIAVWAVPFGIVGGRVYHVLTTPEPYFGAGGDPVRALYIWQGGLGIWGAVVLGGVGAWIACRRRGIPLPVYADALAPGLLVAQAVGRLGNWFNQELFGGSTTLPWALEIDPRFRPEGYEQFATFHPTFLYELLWNLAVAALVVWADRRFQLSHGRAFALYAAGYCLGRGWIEALRIDTAERFSGLRLNVFTAVIVGVFAVAYLVWQRGRPREVLTRGEEFRAREAAGRAEEGLRSGTAHPDGLDPDGPDPDGPDPDGPDPDGPDPDDAAPDDAAPDVRTDPVDDDATTGARGPTGARESPRDGSTRAPRGPD